MTKVGGLNMVSGAKVKVVKLDRELMHALINALLNDLETEREDFVAAGVATQTGMLTLDEGAEINRGIFINAIPKAKFISASLNNSWFPSLVDEGKELIDFWMRLEESYREFVCEQN
jgi:hypothetical protein